MIDHMAVTSQRSSGSSIFSDLCSVAVTLTLRQARFTAVTSRRDNVMSKFNLSPQVGFGLVAGVAAGVVVYLLHQHRNRDRNKKVTKQNGYHVRADRDHTLTANYSQALSASSDVVAASRREQVELLTRLDDVLGSITDLRQEIDSLRSILHGLAEDIVGEVRGATAFLADSSADSIRLAAKSAGLTNAAHRALWLKGWKGDPQTKSKLCSLPCQGEYLFGTKLDEILTKAGERKKGFANSNNYVPFYRRAFRKPAFNKRKEFKNQDRWATRDTKQKATRDTYQNSVRQHDISRLYQSSRRNKIRNAHVYNRRHSNHSRRTSSVPVSAACQRSGQLKSRLPQSSYPPPRRVGPKSSNFQNDSYEMGYTRERSLRHKTKPTTKKICFNVPGRQSRHSRCPSDSLDISESIRFSSSDSSTNSNQEDKGGPGKYNPDCPILAKKTMVFPAQSHVHLGSVDPPGGSGSSFPGALQPPSCEGTKVDSLEFERQLLKLRGFSDSRSEPVQIPQMPPWDINLVLEALTGHPFEPLDLAHIKYISLKTVLLVASHLEENQRAIRRRRYLPHRERTDSTGSSSIYFTAGSGTAQTDVESEGGYTTANAESDYDRESSKGSDEEEEDEVSCETVRTMRRDSADLVTDDEATMLAADPIDEELMLLLQRSDELHNGDAEQKREGFQMLCANKLLYGGRQDFVWRLARSYSDMCEITEDLADKKSYSSEVHHCEDSGLLCVDESTLGKKKLKLHFRQKAKVLSATNGYWPPLRSAVASLLGM
ncbi:unnamed protein product [Ranitomeya imitator]|uniref:Lamina-associated polypeptide 2 alpha C-terminal domain-containing protein n=1 Tax=Ranitomeya imitator TaxID=111125 RepID=A0ABN9L4N0_9NEOB|nr:unnamed protein product [Ranitomeya imitator]